MRLTPLSVAPDPISTSVMITVAKQLGGVFAGSAATLLAWYIKKKQEQDEAGERKVDKLETTVYGGDEWFHEGMVGMLERHDDTIAKALSRIDAVELRVKMVEDESQEINVRLAQLDKGRGRRMKEIEAANKNGK